MTITPNGINSEDFPESTGEKFRTRFAFRSILVIPSRQEAMSIVVLESGSTETPVLITDQCGFDEVAQVEGGIVVLASAEGLPEGLSYMASNPEKLEIIGQNLGKLTRENFLWDHAANKYLESFSRILR